MSLLPLKLPSIDTRLIKHDDKVYKLRLTYESTASCASDQGDTQQQVSFSDASIREEIERIIRVVLHTVSHGITPGGMQTDHFLVDCVCQPWPAATLLVFQQHRQRLQPHCEMLVLTLTAKGKESLTTAVGRQERVCAAESSDGRVVSDNVCRRRGRPAVTDRVTSDNQQQKVMASATQVLPAATNGQRVGKQRFTHIGASPVRCSPRSHTKHSQATQSEKSPPRSTHSNSVSPSKQQALKGQPRHQRRHKGDGDVDQVTPRRTRSQQCQTNGRGLLQKDVEQCVSPDLSRPPLHSRRVHHRGSKAHVQHEELREEMKLQQFARPPAERLLLSPVKNKRPESSLKRRVYDALDVIMTPVKKMFRGGSRVNETPRK